MNRDGPKVEARLGVVPVVSGFYGFFVALVIGFFENMRAIDGFHIVAFMGAATAGLILAKLFGRPGVAGWATACLAAVLATILGSSFAVLLMGTPEMIVAGPVYVYCAVYAHPVVGLVWLLGAGLVHLSARQAAGD